MGSITVLPATRQRCDSRLYPQAKHVLDLATPEGWKAELTYGTWKRTGWDLNPRPVKRNSNAPPQRQHATHDAIRTISMRWASASRGYVSSIGDFFLLSWLLHGVQTVIVWIFVVATVNIFSSVNHIMITSITVSYKHFCSCHVNLYVLIIIIIIIMIGSHDVADGLATLTGCLWRAGRFWLTGVDDGRADAFRTVLATTVCLLNKNSSGDEIANVNFLRRCGTYVLQNTKKRTYFV